MIDQEIREIPVEDLVLWSENPRDPIESEASNQEIVDRALEDRKSKWKLQKLATEMGDYYDLSELPTVVMHGGKPVVYDGNRRVMLAMIFLGKVDVPENAIVSAPSTPERIPCNVCHRRVALDNVFRKHSKSGSWNQLEREYFQHKHMEMRKSTFLVVEEETGIISANPKLNQTFIKNEVFSPSGLRKLGFEVKDEKLLSPHTKEEAKQVLLDVADKVARKMINTREARGRLVDTLSPETQELIKRNEARKPRRVRLSITPDKPLAPSKRTKRTLPSQAVLFGGPLYLIKGQASDLYRDICDLHDFYTKNRDTLSQNFPTVIRMSIRLLCETAAKQKKSDMKKFITDHFDTAKSNLTKDQKTTLSNHSVYKDKIIQLLHTGAHNYSSSADLAQTIAISIAVGAILTETLGRK